MLEVPQALLDERRAKGLDKSEAMWEGELHLVPPPSGEHQAVGAELLLTLAPLGRDPWYEPTGLFRPGADNDWSVPDQMYAHPDRRSERGIEGGPSLVVEILSPNDETYRKPDWYASVGVAEVLAIEPESRRAELFANRDGQMVPVGPVDTQALGVRAETVDGRLRLTSEGGTADI